MNDKKIAEGFPGQRLVVVPPPVIKAVQKQAIAQRLFPTHIGMFQRAVGHYVERPQGTPEYILIGCITGAGSCEIAGKRWHLKPGNVIFLPNEVAHRYKADEENPWSIFWIHFVGQDQHNYLEALHVTAEEPVINISNIGGLLDAFEDIFQHTESGYTDTANLCLSTSLTRFMGICRLYQRAVKANQQHIEDRLLQSIQTMRESLHRSLTLEDLATQAGWSATHYCYLFKKHMNASPIEFFTRLKIHQACNRLKMTNEPISVVADNLGYSDALYFSKQFKQRQGLSPREYRKQFSLL